MTQQIDVAILEKLMEEIVGDQKAKLLALGRRLIPTLTPEDLLQPNDYPELEYNPNFRYEEGILEGLQTMQMAVRAAMRDKNGCKGSDT